MTQIHHAIPVTVITGFLGSGKTTLLASLLKQNDMTRTAVIINEFGDVGLDHALIEHSDENIIELQRGCVCCTIRGDLHKTLLELAEKMTNGTIPLCERIIIETTGLADPVPIIHTLMTSFALQDTYTLASVITLVDAVNGEHTLFTQQECVRQVALAECIILSKTDLTDNATCESLISHLKEINPAVTIIPATHGEVSVSALLDLGSYDPRNKSQDVKAWLAAEEYNDSHQHHHTDHHHDVNRHGELIQAFSMSSEQPVNRMAFSFFLDVIAAQVGPDLLRVKGIVNIAGEQRPAVIHGVQHIFHPVQWLDDWPDDDRRTHVVCITRNMQKKHIEPLFHALMSVVGEDVTPKQVAQAWMQA